MSNVKARVYSRIFLNIAHKDENNNSYIEESELNRLDFGEDKEELIKIMNDVNIKFIKDSEKMTKNNRAPYVKDFDYGEYQEFGITKFDEAVMSKIEYYEDGEIKSEDYKKLDKFLEEEFIPFNVKMKRYKNAKTGDLDFIPSIPLNKIISLKTSELEVKHILNYLSDQGIRVSGYSQDLDGEFENYDYYRNYKNCILPESLSKEQQKGNFALYQLTKDPVIREQLVFHNLRIVPYIVWKFGYSRRYPDIGEKELEQYGYLGLIEAVDRFDVTEGKAFYTYAQWYIKNEIIKGIFETRGIKRHQDISAFDLTSDKLLEIESNPQSACLPFWIRETVMQLESEYGKMPTLEQIAERAGIDVKSLKSKIEGVKDRIGLIYHLDISELYDQDVLAWDVYRDIYCEDEEYEKVEQSDLHDALDYALKSLSPGEEIILKKYFGYDDGVEMTYKELGEYFNISESSAYRKIKRALRKLRNPLIRKELENYKDCSGKVYRTRI